MLVLAADKGFTREEDLALLQGPPQLEFHASNHCFSQVVNFDAIARYFYGIDGTALLPQKHFSSLSICAFLERRPGDEFPATRKAYDQALAGFGPDDLFALMSWLNAHLEEVSLVQALALLRLTRWDTTALLRLFPVIARQLRTVTGERNDLRNAVLSTWANRLSRSAPRKTCLRSTAAWSCWNSGSLPKRRPCSRHLSRLLGRSAATSYNLGLCALGMDRPAEALAYMIEACELDPNFEPAKASRAKAGRRKHAGLRLTPRCETESPVRVPPSLRLPAPPSDTIAAHDCEGAGRYSGRADKRSRKDDVMVAARRAGGHQRPQFL